MYSLDYFFDRFDSTKTNIESPGTSHLKTTKTPKRFYDELLYLLSLQDKMMEQSNTYNKLNKDTKQELLYSLENTSYIKVN